MSIGTIYAIVAVVAASGVAGAEGCCTCCCSMCIADSLFSHHVLKLSCRTQLPLTSAWLAGDDIATYVNAFFLFVFVVILGVVTYFDKKQQQVE